MTICCISFHPCSLSLRKQIWPCHKHGHHLNEFGSTWVRDAVYQVSRSSASWFRKRRFLKVFAMYGPGSHLGHVTQNIWTNFHPNIPWRRLHMKFGFKRPSVFWGKEVWNVESEWPWTTVSERPWTWVVINFHVLIYLTMCTNFHITDSDLLSFWKKN